MITTDFTITETVKASPEEAFKAITQQIPDWWSRQFKGASGETGQTFTVSFDAHGNTFKKMKIGKLIPNKLVEWECIDAFINMEFLGNKKEWIGTKIIWELEGTATGTQIKLTHEGLTTEFECYELCDKGWQQFFGSLVKMLNTGVGVPFS